MSFHPNLPNRSIQMGFANPCLNAPFTDPRICRTQTGRFPNSFEVWLSTTLFAGTLRDYHPQIPALSVVCAYVVLLFGGFIPDPNPNPLTKNRRSLRTLYQGRWMDVCMYVCMYALFTLDPRRVGRLGMTRYRTQYTNYQALTLRTR